MLSRTLRFQPFPLGKGSIEIAIELGRAFLANPPDLRHNRTFHRFSPPSIALGCKGSACDNPVLNRLLKAAQREHAPYRPYGPRPSARHGTAATAKERRPGLYAIRRRHGIHHHEPVQQVRGSRDDESTDFIDMRGIWPSENGRSARYSIPRAPRGRWNGDTLDSI